MGVNSNEGSDVNFVQNSEAINNNHETNDSFICISDLESQLVTDDELINGVPDHQFYLGFKTTSIPDAVLFNDENRFYHYFSKSTY